MVVSQKIQTVHDFWPQSMYLFWCLQYEWYRVLGKSDRYWKFIIIGMSNKNQQEYMNSKPKQNHISILEDMELVFAQNFSF